MASNSQNDINLQLQEILQELFEIPKEKIVPEALLADDLDLDSIDVSNARGSYINNTRWCSMVDRMSRGYTARETY